MKRTVKVLGAALLALTLLAPLAWATQVLYRNPQQLGSESALVVRGEVADVRSYWNESRTKILTETRIDVAQRYKGAAGSTINIVQLGGVVGNVRMTVHGALSWRPGEEVLLFLEPFQDGDWQVSGFMQGKYRVARDDNGQPFVMDAPAGDAEVVGAPGAEGRIRPSGPVALDDFVNQALGRR
jgi:hypothetical protein